MLNQLQALGVPWLYFDFKQDARHLPNDTIWVFRWNWLKLNPLLAPKGVQQTQWVQTLADIFAHVFGWFHGSENYLLEFLHKLLDSSRGVPTLKDLYELIKKAEERTRKRMDYFDVVMNRLQSMLLVLGDVIDCKRGLPIEELLKHPVVLELDGLRRDEANFLVELILAYIFHYRIANGERGKLKHVLVFDEATRVFFKSRQWRETTLELGMPFVDVVPQIIRDYCEGMIFAAQEPSIISHSVLANTNLKIIGFLGEGEDIDRIAQSLDLSLVERSTISKLRCGEWIVKKQGIRPFLMKSFDFQLKKNVTDKQLFARMKNIISKLSGLSVLKNSKSRAANRKTVPIISKDAVKLLLNVNEHPFRGIASRYKMLGFSVKRGEKAKHELLHNGLAKVVSVSLGNYRPIKFLVPSSRGIEYLEDMGCNVKLWDFLGNVSFEHRLLQVLIAYIYRRLGKEARVEKELRGYRWDIVVNEGKKRTAIEIACSSNVDLKKLTDGAKLFDRILIICKDLRTAGIVESLIYSKLSPAARGKMQIWVASAFLSKLKGNLNAGFEGKKAHKA